MTTDDAPPRRPPRGKTWLRESRGSLAAYRFYFHFSRIVGRVLSYFCTGPALLYYMLFAGQARRASMEYLGRALGPASWPVQVARSFRHIFNFAAALIDRSLILSRGEKVFEFTLDGHEHITDLADRGEGCVLLSCHLGNMELAGAVLPKVQVQFHQVMAEPLDEDLQRFIEEKAGGRLPPTIRLDGAPMASLNVLRALREGDMVGMKSDRVFDNNYVELPFLGEPARFPTGPLTVAALAKAPVILLLCLKEGGKGYRIIAEAPQRFEFQRGRPRDEQVREWLGWYVERLEHYVRRYPYQWYNFYPFWDRDAQEDA
jgi:predicted LPLAT superfamily acyltransferase